jgi:hypothetical protein
MQKKAPQKPIQPARVFRLGMLKQEVLQAFGQPSGCYVPESSQYYPISECAAAHRVWDRVFEVYHRKTATNEYQIEFIYGPDSRESRLHPKIRLGRLDFLLDKPRSADAVLADVPEIALWCSAGCLLSGGESLLVCPENPTDEQRQLAALAAAEHLPDDGDFHWIPTIELLPDKELQDTKPLSREKWLKVSIKQVIFSASSTCYGTDLGDFPPKR